MHILKKKKTINQTNGCGQVSFHFFFGFLQCLYVFVCLSCLSLLYGNSRITSFSANVDFLVIRNKLDINYIKYTIQISSTEVSEKRWKKMKEYVLSIDKSFLHLTKNENNKNITTKEI